MDLQHLRSGTVPSCNMPFFWGHSSLPTPQPHLEPAMLSVDFWEPIEVVEGLVGGPAKWGRAEHGGGMMHPELCPAPQHL